MLLQYGWPISFNPRGFVRRPNGTAPAIVHQYERSEVLAERLAQTYGQGPPPEVDWRGEGCKGCLVDRLDS